VELSPVREHLSTRWKYGVPGKKHKLFFESKQ
jgi:hypothetical protein